jgi:uncharacterized protein
MTVRRKNKASRDKDLLKVRTHIDDLALDPRLQRMKGFIQHGQVTTLDHVERVAFLSVRINRRLGLGGDEDVLIRGALLHDYYLYDWHHHDGHLHGFTHPDTAAARASQDFTLSDKERNIISSHMWPLTLRHLPRSREAATVCLADKLSSLYETLLCR